MIGTAAGPTREPSVFDDDLLDDAELARRVRRKLAKVAALSLLPVLLILVWMSGDGWEGLFFPVAVLVFMVVQFVRVALAPHRYPQLLRSDPTTGVLAAGGLPDTPRVRALSVPERRLAIRDLLDQLGDGGTGGWNKPWVASVGRISLGVMTLGWAGVGGAAAFDAAWGPAAFFAGLSVVFGGLLVFGERHDRRRNRAVALLHEELAALPAGETDPSRGEATLTA